MIYLFVNLKEPFVNPSKTNYQCRRSQNCFPPSCARLCRFALQRTPPPRFHDDSVDCRMSRICSLSYSYFVCKFIHFISKEEQLLNHIFCYLYQEQHHIPLFLFALQYSANVLYIAIPFQGHSILLSDNWHH